MREKSGTTPFGQQSKLDMKYEKFQEKNIEMQIASQTPGSNFNIWPIWRYCIFFEIFSTYKTFYIQSFFSFICSICSTTPKPHTVDQLRYAKSEWYISKINQRVDFLKLVDFVQIVEIMIERQSWWYYNNLRSRGPIAHYNYYKDCDQTSILVLL